MFKLRNGFGLHIFANRTVTFSGTLFGLSGGRSYFPLAEGVVGQIELFPAGTLLPVLGFVIFPCLVMDAVLMDRQCFDILVSAGGAGALSGTCFLCGGGCYRPLAEGVASRFGFLAAAAFFPVLGFIALPASITVLMRLGIRIYSTAGIAADCPVAPFTPTCYRILAVRVTDNVNRPGSYFKRIRIFRLCDILRREKHPPVYLNAFRLEHLAVQY